MLFLDLFNLFGELKFLPFCFDIESGKDFIFFKVVESLGITNVLLFKLWDAILKT
jgi:hypothetical protein